MATRATSFFPTGAKVQTNRPVTDLKCVFWWSTERLLRGNHIKLPFDLMDHCMRRHRHRSSARRRLHRLVYILSWKRMLAGIGLFGLFYMLFVPSARDPSLIIVFFTMLGIGPLASVDQRGADEYDSGRRRRLEDHDERNHRSTRRKSTSDDWEDWEDA